jgi:mercuric ion binding protein
MSVFSWNKERKMKLKSLFASLIILIASSMSLQAAERQSVVLDVENFTCTMCKYTIKKALKNVEGVESVDVNPDNKTASIVFDPQKTAIDALINATTQAGYPSTVKE